MLKKQANQLVSVNGLEINRLNKFDLGSECMRVRKDEERSTENLSIRMKPSVKLMLRNLANQNDMGMAEMIEKLVRCEIGLDEK